VSTDATAAAAWLAAVTAAVEEAGGDPDVLLDHLSPDGAEFVDSLESIADADWTAPSFDRTVRALTAMFLAEYPDLRVGESTEAPAEAVRAAFDPHEPRVPGGHEGGGRWGSIGGAVSKAVKSMRDEATIRDTYEYKDPHTGFETRVKHIRGDRSIYVTVTIHDRHGTQVGNAERVIRPDGQHTVNHGGLILLPDYQGQGFATRYNERAEAAYREAGIKEITLEANIDVGGYSWAAAGYDFQTSHDRAEIAHRAHDKMKAFNPDVQAAIRKVADDPNFTPLQMAMVGWYPGATMWPGKRIMLGSHWGGVKKL
jgi:GNAT superfamily N-acetyltransferase